MMIRTYLAFDQPGRSVAPTDISWKVYIAQQKLVTEGSSDSYIRERAMKCLRHDIADFFYFVDMEEQYQFTGIGNLYKFCQGLSSIKIQNNVMVIFDNDAAGVEKFEKLRNLSKPKNMHLCKLPDHNSFCSIKTIGPNGISNENINERIRKKCNFYFIK